MCVCVCMHVCVCVCVCMCVCVYVCLHIRCMCEDNIAIIDFGRTFLGNHLHTHIQNNVCK